MTIEEALTWVDAHLQEVERRMQISDPDEISPGILSDMTRSLRVIVTALRDQSSNRETARREFGALHRQVVEMWEALEKIHRLATQAFEPTNLTQQMGNTAWRALSSAPAASGWISVAERMPEKREIVLVGSISHKKVRTGYWKDDGWVFSNFTPAYVTHWQPLPDGPVAAPATKGVA